MNVSSIYSRYKIDIQDGKIYDPIRLKYLKQTPEEIVRQKTIKFLINRLKVPKDKIIVETALRTLGVESDKKDNRIDIGILDEEGLLIAVVECKAGVIGTKEAPYLQAQDYLVELNTRYFFVTDGVEFNGYFWNTERFIKLNEIPKYDRFYYYPTEE